MQAAFNKKKSRVKPPLVNGIGGKRYSFGTSNADSAALLNPFRRHCLYFLEVLLQVVLDIRASILSSSESQADQGETNWADF